MVQKSWISGPGPLGGCGTGFLDAGTSLDNGFGTVGGCGMGFVDCSGVLSGFT